MISTKPRLHFKFVVLSAIFLAVVMSSGRMTEAQSALPMLFSSPQEAASAFYKAVKERDRKKVWEILGPTAKDWLLSGDPVADRKAGERFVAAYEQKNQLEKRGANIAILVVGNDTYPFPFPIVLQGGRWMFDAEGGKQELLVRRIGKNELTTAQVLLAIVDAQYEYASEVRDGSGSQQYARRFRSNPNKRDGLYWPTKSGEEQSPLGPLAVGAGIEGYDLSRKSREPIPYHGYYYRILFSQGGNAPDGAIKYVVKGRMIGGFAVLAYPAKYRASGIVTFIINHDGIIYEKDLGPDTKTQAASIRSFNPDRSWNKQAK
ncbi:MAG: DUF2950 domain-containing protein [Alphaproteobacteria bacterium]|nr:DUF2950 domain-containing protein [Alphaproteobacteria bacterium]